MSLQAVKEITDLEKSLEEAKLEGSAAAKKRIADADRAAQAQIARARESADEKVREMVAEAENRAAGVTRQIKLDTDRAKSALSDRAEANMGKAVDLIVERVMELS